MQFSALLIKDPKVRDIFLVVTEDKDAVVQGNKKVSPSNFSNMTCLFIQQKKTQKAPLPLLCCFVSKPPLKFS